ncbi:keratin-associated protein 5-2-like [Macrosteles quadrilineatus]|uniref:keratin-associated protein 5-2-like n=1 Tax=Macrosteles quadrilineatus TaxID=74068 RepID=UPI0023E16485|nr:keratin-associated protein 5-2-like [Macrosteles quadrilineatus]
MGIKSSTSQTPFLSLPTPLNRITQTMAHLPTLCTILACIVVYLTYRCDASKAKCAIADVDPDDCVYGTHKDFCGKLVCAKGPGMRCGGPSDILGKCGEGMQCKCERCTGCGPGMRCGGPSDILGKCGEGMQCKCERYWSCCVQGPGMRCGGPSDILGKCGEGMQCKCERCTGCSLHTLKCDFSEFLCLD